MNETTRGTAPAWARWGTVAALAAAACSAQAQDSRFSVYLEAGQARHHGATTDTATVGLRAPTGSSFFGGRLTLDVDAYASQWHADALPGARENFLQLGIVPMFRWRFDEGRSPWFVEAGVGISYLTNDYETVNKRFGTRWNFSDHLGVGRSFGEQGRHQLGLYVKHVSNAGLSSPNPGETFYLLRYGYAL